MDFKIGQFYKTRDGRKAQIFMLDNGNGYALGAIFIDGIWIKAEWKKIGVSLAHGNPELDLVSEWREPIKYSVELWGDEWNNKCKTGAFFQHVTGATGDHSPLRTERCPIKYRITVEEVSE